MNQHQKPTGVLWSRDRKQKIPRKAGLRDQNTAVLAHQALWDTWWATLYEEPGYDQDPCRAGPTTLVTRVHLPPLTALFRPLSLLLRPARQGGERTGLPVSSADVPEWGHCVTVLHQSAARMFTVPNAPNLSPL